MSDEFPEKFQTASDPHPHFWKIMLQIFMMDMVTFMQGGVGQIVSVNISIYQLISVQLLKTSQELRMLSRSLSDCQSTI